MGSFGEASSKDTCFSFYLKRKTFYIIILAIRFYYGAKKSPTFRRISVTMEKSLVKNWCGKTQVTSSKIIKHELKSKSAISGKVLLPSTVGFSTSYKWWIVIQMLLISASSLPASASSPSYLLFPTKQP